MKDLGRWLQSMSPWLVGWLTSKWGATLVQIGTLALAVIAATYLTRTYEHQAHGGGSVSGAISPVPVQSWCTTVAGVLTCTGCRIRDKNGTDEVRKPG
jgi:hypothetical protein